MTDIEERTLISKALFVRFTLGFKGKLSVRRVLQCDSLLFVN